MVESVDGVFAEAMQPERALGEDGTTINRPTSRPKMVTIAVNAARMPCRTTTPRSVSPWLERYGHNPRYGLEHSRAVSRA